MCNYDHTLLFNLIVRPVALAMIILLLVIEVVAKRSDARKLKESMTTVGFLSIGMEILALEVSLKAYADLLVSSTFSGAVNR